MLDLAEKVINLTGSKSKIIKLDLPKDDPERRCPDISKAIKYLGWKPTTKLGDGLKKTIEYFRK